MKSFWMVGMASVVLVACNDSASVNVHINDSVGKKFEDKAERLLDSTKENLKQTGKKLEEKAKGAKLKVKLEHKDSSKHD